MVAHRQRQGLLPLNNHGDHGATVLPAVMVLSDAALSFTPVTSTRISVH